MKRRNYKTKILSSLLLAPFLFSCFPNPSPSQSSSSSTSYVSTEKRVGLTTNYLYTEEDSFDLRNILRLENGATLEDLEFAFGKGAKALIDAGVLKKTAAHALGSLSIRIKGSKEYRAALRFVFAPRGAKAGEYHAKLPSSETESQGSEVTLSFLSSSSFSLHVEEGVVYAQRGGRYETYDFPETQVDGSYAQDSEIDRSHIIVFSSDKEGYSSFYGAYDEKDGDFGFLLRLPLPFVPKENAGIAVFFPYLQE